jgi:Dna[CI] antecedent DciA-like protein
VLSDALSGRADAAPAALTAAFAEACGWPLAREVALRGATRDGRLLVVASTRGWAEQVEALAGTLRARVNARLRREAVAGLEVRVGPLGR